MKKYLPFILSAIFIFLGAFSFALNVSAEKNEALLPATLEPVDCFTPGLYKFQSVQVSVGPEEPAYNAGQSIGFIGNVINENNYPVVDGNVFVRISKVNKEYLTDGHNAVDEIMAVTGLSIDASSSVPVTFFWKSPKDLGAGEYRADYFFSVGKKFNLGGLPFTNEIIVGYSSFKINNTQNTTFVLDRTGTKVNGGKYNHIGNWPSVPKDAKIEITQPIKNLSNKEIKAEVGYDLYFWDSLNEADKINSKKEIITIPANSVKNLSYLIPKSEQSVYYLRIKATVGTASSIVNVRVSSEIEKSRINYPAITAFPLLKGESAKLFSCFHNTYGVTDNKLRLTLTDEKGKTVAQGEYAGTLSQEMSGAQMDFTAKKDYRLLNLKAELLDSSGKVMDSYENKYDCASLKSAKCAESVKGDTWYYSIALLLISLIGLFIIIKFIKPSVFKKIFVGIFIVLAVISLVILIMTITRGINNADAETASADGRVKSETRTSWYDIYYYNGEYKDSKTGQMVQDCRKLALGDISLTYQASLVGNLALLKNETLRVDPAGQCTYNATGGYWDTPNCGVPMAFKQGGISDYYVGTTTISVASLPAMSLVSSNPNVLSCSGNVCIAKSSGVVTLTGTFGSTPVGVSSIEWLQYPKDLNPDGKLLKSVKFSYPGGASTKPIHMSLESCQVNKNNSSPNVNISGYSPTWEVRVIEPPTGLRASCPYPGTTANLSWNREAGANAYIVKINNGRGNIVTNNAYQATTVPGQTYSWSVSSAFGNINNLLAYSFDGSAITAFKNGFNFTCSNIDPRGVSCKPSKYSISTTKPEGSCSDNNTKTVNGDGGSSSPWTWTCGDNICRSYNLSANQLCGTANGTTRFFEPTLPSQLCLFGEEGNPSSVTSGSDSWSWSCTYNSIVSNCSATKLGGVGYCGKAATTTPSSVKPTADLCYSDYAGTPPTVTEGSSSWTWECPSPNTDEEPSLCSATILSPNLACGNAHGNSTLKTAPTSEADLCKLGTSSIVSENNGVFTWKCSNIDCSAGSSNNCVGSNCGDGCVGDNCGSEDNIGSCGSINATYLENKPTKLDPLCSAGRSSLVVDGYLDRIGGNKIGEGILWWWSCNGKTKSASCYAINKNVWPTNPSEIMSCTISKDTNDISLLNKKVVWSVTPNGDCANCKNTWMIDNDVSKSDVKEFYGKDNDYSLSLNKKVFTTVGDKNITALLFLPLTNDPFFKVVSSCSTSTTVVQQGGGTSEI